MPEVLVRDMQAQVVARVQAVLVPAIPVDGQVAVRGQQPVDDGAVRPVVGDEQQLVPWTARVGEEPLRIGGLMERIDRHVERPAITAANASDATKAWS